MIKHTREDGVVILAHLLITESPCSSCSCNEFTTEQYLSFARKILQFIDQQKRVCHETVFS